jgi:acyl carrier protein
MRDSDGLQARIAALLLDRLHLDVPSDETDLIDTGALDSMLFVELLAQLESEFGVAIGLDDIEVNAFRSIRSIAEFVRGRTSRAESWGHGG